MTFYYTLLLIPLAVITYLSYLGTRLVLKALQHKKIMDTPNTRSSHSTPTPRGGGIVIAGMIIAGMLVMSIFLGKLSYEWPLIAVIWLLALVSFADDIKGLSVRIRLSVQAFAVAVGVLYLEIPLLEDMPWFVHGLTYAFIGLAWLWFVNLYNFMDGIDGITSVETLSIMLGVLLVSGVVGIPLGMYTVLIAGAVLGFLFFNWHPAAIFMGDVGSVVLGFVVGWLLLELAVAGHVIPALILPLYYLMDSGITITKRALKKENIFKAHASHFYQRAVQAGKTHAQVSVLVLKTNLVLVLIAVLAANIPSLVLQMLCLAVALLVVGVVLSVLAGRPVVRWNKQKN